MLLPVKTKDGIEKRYEEIMDKRPDEGLFNLKYVYMLLILNILFIIDFIRFCVQKNQKTYIKTLKFS